MERWIPSFKEKEMGRWRRTRERETRRNRCLDSFCSSFLFAFSIEEGCSRVVGQFFLVKELIRDIRVTVLMCLVCLLHPWTAYAHSWLERVDIPNTTHLILGTWYLNMYLTLSHSSQTLLANEPRNIDFDFFFNLPILVVGLKNVVKLDGLSRKRVGRNGFELGLHHTLPTSMMLERERVFQRIKYLGLDGSSSAGDVERWAKV